MVWARILLGVRMRSFRMRCRGRVYGKVFQRLSMLETSFLVRSVGNVRQFFLLVFRMVRARILPGVRSFRMCCRGRVYGKVFQRFSMLETSFLVRSVGNIRQFFWHESCWGYGLFACVAEDVSMVRFSNGFPC